MVKVAQYILTLEDKCSHHSSCLQSTGRQHTVLDHMLVSRHSGQKQRQANLHTISLPCYATIGPCRSMQKGAKKMGVVGHGDLFEPKTCDTTILYSLVKTQQVATRQVLPSFKLSSKHRQATHCFGPYVGESPQWSKTEAGQPSYRTRPPTIHTACALEERR